MIAYHEITPSSLQSALAEGLKCSDRGKKGEDTAIARTDKILDKYRPDVPARAGISRNHSLYAYVVQDGLVVRITDGKPVPVAEFVAASDQAVLCLTIDPARCYVADLDEFDRVKEVSSGQHDDAALVALCRRYWDSLVPLTKFQPGSVRRPEIMITYDVPPACIEPVSPGRRG